MKILLATNNQDKRKEISEVLFSCPVEIVLPETWRTTSLPDVIEDGKTYEENSLKKARSYSLWSGLNSLADDTGLEVEALKGEPGVYSARYAGENASYKDNIDLLLEKLKGEENRMAKFVCVVCLFLANSENYFFRGEIRGRITYSTHGNKGFGYDPIFLPEGHAETFAQMPQKLKNSISHRALALKAFSDWLKSFDLNYIDN
ncbi:RdgB/HAM1 family non-canonical purine NTP pyrophosphatase [candidate division WOR-3 bacterium]|nr:RdgB/HAM1 family non-canonical purine NTP pyrophosphatase [candidate division WOR-3 bacterium]